MERMSESHTRPDENPETVTRQRAQGDTAHTRHCLACDKPFESEGWHNRLCPQCRKRSGDAG